MTTKHPYRETAVIGDLWLLEKDALLETYDMRYLPESLADTVAELSIAISTLDADVFMRRIQIRKTTAVLSRRADGGLAIHVPEFQQMLIDAIFCAAHAAGFVAYDIGFTSSGYEVRMYDLDNLDNCD